MINKTQRATEIDQLVRFIRSADIQNARRSLTEFFRRGERISREIVWEYERLEHYHPPLTQRT